MTNLNLFAEKPMQGMFTQKNIIFIIKYKQNWQVHSPVTRQINFLFPLKSYNIEKQVFIMQLFFILAQNQKNKFLISLLHNLTKVPFSFLMWLANLHILF